VCRVGGGQLKFAFAQQALRREHSQTCSVSAAGLANDRTFARVRCKIKEGHWYTFIYLKGMIWAPLTPKTAFYTLGSLGGRLRGPRAQGIRV
jgi:hypothetical protein